MKKQLLWAMLFVVSMTFSQGTIITDAVKKYSFNGADPLTNLGSSGASYNLTSQQGQAPMTVVGVRSGQDKALNVAGNRFTAGKTTDAAIQSYTASFWYKGTDTNITILQQYGNVYSSVNGGFFIKINADGEVLVKTEAGMNGSISQASVTKTITGFAINDNTWHHIVVSVVKKNFVASGTNNHTGAGITQSVYIDGEKKSESTSGTGIYSRLQTTSPNDNIIVVPANEDLLIHESTNGALDNLRFYNRNLTDQEVKGIYNVDTYTGSKFADYKFNDNFENNALSGYGPITGATSTAFVEDRYLNTNSALKVNQNSMKGIIVPADTDNPINSFSISLWFKTPVVTSRSASRVFQLNSSNAPYIALEFSNTNKVIVADKLNRTNKSVSTVRTDVFDDNWHHLALTISKVNSSFYKEVYIDGQLEQALSGVSSLQGANFYTAPIEFLLAQGSYKYSGVIDDIEIHTKKLTVAEIKQLADEATTTWTAGAGNQDWLDADNWSNGLPSVTNKAIIKQLPSSVTSFYPSMTNEVTTGDIIISSGVELGIESSGRLTTGNIDGRGSISLYADAFNTSSLIADDISNQIQVFKSLPLLKDQWQLISVPVSGMNVSNVVTNGQLASGTNGNKGLGVYNNTLSQPWEYYNTANASNWTTFEQAKGYAINTTANGLTLTLNGTVDTGDVAYTGVGSASNSFELIGNPYTAFLSVADFLTVNDTKLKATNKALYIWNGATNSYEVVNNATSTTHLVPSQGFFVETATPGGTIEFNPSMLSHQSTGVLQRTAPQEEVVLQIATGMTTEVTSIKYLSNTTSALDSGYDAGYFDGGQSKIGVYTKLADGSYVATKFMLQCVSSTDKEETVIPLGIKTDVSQEVEFSLTSMNLPENLYVLLEDKSTGVVTNLTTGGSYKATVNGGEGRFYLHTKPSARLSVEDTVLSTDLGIVKVSNELLEVNGLVSSGTVSVYTITGELVVGTKVSENNSVVTLPSLSTGVYVVQLTTNGKQLTKKIIIE